MSKHTALEVSFKAFNDIAGSNGLVLIMLVFFVMPRILLLPTELPAQVERMKAPGDAWKEMAPTIAKNRVNKALKNKLPQATMAEIRISDDVLVSRDGSSVRVGPYLLHGILGENFISSFDENGMQCSVDRVRKYRRDMTVLTQQ